MKKKVFIIFVVLILGGYFNFQFAFAESIVEHLDLIFSAEKMTYKSEKYIVVKINKLPEENHFSSLVNPNSTYLDYLYVNFSKVDTKELLKTSDQKELQKKFIEKLKKDKKFIKLLKELCI